MHLVFFACLAAGVQKICMRIENQVKFLSDPVTVSSEPFRYVIVS